MRTRMMLVLWVSMAALRAPAMTNEAADLYGPPYLTDLGVARSLQLIVRPDLRASFPLDPDRVVAGPASLWHLQTRLSWIRSRTSDRRISHLYATADLDAGRYTDHENDRLSELDLSGSAVSGLDFYPGRGRFFLQVGPEEPLVLWDLQDQLWDGSHSDDLLENSAPGMVCRRASTRPVLLGAEARWAVADDSETQGEIIHLGLDSDLVAGVGWGRIHSITSVRRAVVVERRLREAGALTAPFTIAELRDIARALDRGPYVEDREDPRSARLWYAEIEKALRATGKVRQLGFYEAMDIRSALAREPIAWRRSGFRVAVGAGTGSQLDVWDEEYRLEIDPELTASLQWSVPRGTRWQFDSEAWIEVPIEVHDEPTVRDARGLLHLLLSCDTDRWGVLQAGWHTAVRGNPDDWYGQSWIALSLLQYYGYRGTIRYFLAGGIARHDTNWSFAPDVDRGRFRYLYGDRPYEKEFAATAGSEVRFDLF